MKTILVVSVLLATAAAADLHHVHGMHNPGTSAPSLVYQEPRAQVREDLGQITQQATQFSLQPEDQQNLGQVSNQGNAFSFQIQNQQNLEQGSSQKASDFSFQSQNQQQPQQVESQQQGIELMSFQDTTFQSQPQQQVSNGVFFRVEGSQEDVQSQQSVNSFDDQVFDFQVSTTDQQNSQNVFSLNTDELNSFNNQFDSQSQDAQALDTTNVDAQIQSQQTFVSDIQQSSFPVIETPQVQQQVFNIQDNVQSPRQTYNPPRPNQFVFTQNVQDQNTAQVLPQPLQPNNQQFISIPQTLPQPIQHHSQQQAQQTQNQFVNTPTQTRPLVSLPSRPIGEQPQAPPQRPQVQPQPIEVVAQPQLEISTKPFERPSSSLKPLSRPQSSSKISITKCEAGFLADVDGNCVEPQISRNIFLYAAPPKQRSFVKRLVAPKPKLEYNIVFVRNPDEEEDSRPIVVPPPQQKTLVYVLNEKSEAEEQGLIETPSHPKLKPEVYFVNYGQGENPELPGGIDLQSALREMVLEGTVIEDVSDASFGEQEVSPGFDDAQEISGAVDVQTQTTVADSNEGPRGYDYNQQNPSLLG